jgi:hypothetical protein
VPCKATQVAPETVTYHAHSEDIKDYEKDQENTGSTQRPIYRKPREVMSVLTTNDSTELNTPQSATTAPKRLPYVVPAPIL